MIYAFMALYHELDKTKVITVSSAQAQMQEEEVSATPDPCGLAVVVCEDETPGIQVKTKVTGNHGIESKVRKTFYEDPNTGYATMMGESGGNPRAMGWNCEYWATDKNGKPYKYSAACKPEDRGKAWSVDCGLMQINHIGKICPEELFDVDHNLIVGRGIYDRGGWNRWWAYKSGTFKKFL